MNHAQLHRAVHSAEHDPPHGLIHGYCILCGVPYPCDYIGEPPAAGATTTHHLGDKLILTCKVLEVGEDGVGRHGIMLEAADKSEVFVPCDKETARLVAKHLMEDAELILRPRP